MKIVFQQRLETEQNESLFTKYLLKKNGEMCYFRYWQGKNRNVLQEKIRLFMNLQWSDIECINFDNVLIYFCSWDRNKYE